MTQAHQKMKWSNAYLHHACLNCRLSATNAEAIQCLNDRDIFNNVVGEMF